MLKKLLSVAAILWINQVCAQSDFSSGESFGMANIYSVGEFNSTSININSAIMAYLKGNSFQASQILPYGISDLSISEITGFVSLNKHSGISASFRNESQQLIRKQNATLAYGLQLNQTLSGGIKLHYFNWHQGDSYPNFQLIVPEFGLHYSFNRHIQIGSVMRISTGSTPFTATQNSFRLGCNWHTDAKLSSMYEISITDETIGASLGVHYQSNERWRLLMGYQPLPSSVISFGSTLQINNHFSLTASSQWHNHLGFSPSITLTIY